jgi:hypothetical protein
MAFKLNSPAFRNEEDIPRRHTCEGEDLSPALDWVGVPEGTQSLALIVDDPDAPDPRAPKMTFVHWVAYNLPPDAGGLPEGAGSHNLPEGAGEGINDFKRVGWGGPCPPVGQHRYYFKLYALDERLPDLGRPTKTLLEEAMKGHVLGETMLLGVYEKQGV